jgi:hypothetical protein
MNKQIYNKKAQLSLAIILAMIALILGLIFALPVILPDSVKTMIENYKITKIIDQVESEKKASLEGYPALSVVGHKTVVNSTDMTIQTYLLNVGGSKAVDPTIKEILVKNAESHVQIGEPILGGIWKIELAPGEEVNFNFNIIDTAIQEQLTLYPDEQLELDIKFLYYSISGHQWIETESVVVNPKT